MGDSENDRAMLEKAGVAAVMANGMEQIRKLADIVSENDNDHDGVAEILPVWGSERHSFGVFVQCIQALMQNIVLVEHYQTARSRLY